MKLSKRMLAFLLAFAMVLVNAPTPLHVVRAVNADGYIEIRTVEELYAVRDDLSANYILMEDIDLTEATAKGGDWDFFGNGWNPIGSKDIYSNDPFTGTFDGNGHTIRGMRIDVTSRPSGTGDVYLGLFANVSGTVRDLTMVDAKIYLNDAGTCYIGSVAGRCSGTIEDCHSFLSISNTKNSNSNTRYIGGLVGYCFDGSISRSSNHGTIDAACDRLGGIAGNSTDKAKITQCYNAGSLKNSSFSHGISGGGQIIDCYNTATVEGYHTYGIGGTATRCYNRGNTIANSSRYAVSSDTSTGCFYLSGTGGSNTGSTSLTEAQMKLQGMYPGFDFETVWVIDTNANYPYPQLRSNARPTH